MLLLILHLVKTGAAGFPVMLVWARARPREFSARQLWDSKLFITLVSFLVKIVFVFSSEHSPVVAKVRGLELAQFERLGRSFHRHQRPVRLENLSGIFEPHHLTIEYIVKAAGFSICAKVTSQSWSHSHAVTHSEFSSKSVI